MKEGDLYSTSQSGMIKIVKYNSWADVRVRFLDTGYETTTRAGSARRGIVKDKLKKSVYGVGYVGDGRHKTSKNSKDTKQYSAWRHMIGRCYDEATQNKHPTYKGCTVCDEWHNFQLFADWYELTYPKDGLEYAIDKDIMSINGVRVYSKSTCCWVTAAKNNEKAQAKNYNFIDNKGNTVSVYNLAKYCTNKNLDYTSMRRVANGERASYKTYSTSN